MEYFLVNLSLCSILVYIIIDDLNNYRIRNGVIGLLLALFVIDMVISGSYQEAGVQLAIATAFFLGLLIPYARGALGGGDVKLLGVAFLWLGGPQRLEFAILFLLLTLAYVAAAKVGLAPSRGEKAAYIPFAPSIAGAWLLTILASALIGDPQG